MPDSSCDRTLQNRSRKQELLSVWRKEGVEGMRAIYLHKKYHISDKLDCYLTTINNYTNTHGAIDRQ